MLFLWYPSGLAHWEHLPPALAGQYGHLLGRMFPGKGLLLSNFCLVQWLGISAESSPRLCCISNSNSKEASQHLFCGTQIREMSFQAQEINPMSNFSRGGSMGEWPTLTTAVSWEQPYWLWAVHQEQLFLETIYRLCCIWKQNAMISFLKKFWSLLLFMSCLACVSWKYFSTVLKWQQEFLNGYNQKLDQGTVCLSVVLGGVTRLGIISRDWNNGASGCQQTVKRGVEWEPRESGGETERWKFGGSRL